MVCYSLAIFTRLNCLPSDMIDVLVGFVMSYILRCSFRGGGILVNACLS